MALVDLTVRLGALLQEPSAENLFDAKDTLLPELLEELLRLKVINQYAYDPRNNAMLNLANSYRPPVETVYQVVYFGDE